jgi:hypothetical protein
MRPWLVGWAAFPTAVGIIVATFAVAKVTDFWLLFVVGFPSALVVATFGAVRGIGGLMEARRLGLALGPLAWIATILATLCNSALLAFGFFVALMTTLGFGRGRQIRRAGRILLPPVKDGASWTSPALDPHVDEAVRADLAAQWRENGRTEHASVAAFARLTLDLMSLGAPPRLVAAAQRDALDEIRHAELCFALARALDGRAASPAPWDEVASARTLSRIRTLALARLAVESLVDGALHEGVSARIIAQLARRCEDEAIARMLREIAADEGRHSAHGFEVTAWCLAQGGAPVAQALRGALRAIPDVMHSSLPAASHDGAWERHGIPGRALESDEYAKARTHVVRRVEQLIAGVAA